MLELAKVAKRPRSLFGTFRPFMAPEVQEREAVAGFGWGINFGWLRCGWMGEFLSTWLNAGSMLRKYDHGICALVCSRTLPSQNTLD